jgi:PAS domain S-box-containing protein
MSFADRREAIGTSLYWLDTWPRRYGFALAAVTAAALFRYELSVDLQFTQPFIMFYPTILLIALLCGLGPGVLATLLATVIADYWLLPPMHSFVVGRLRDLVSLVIFAAMGIALSEVGELLRRYLRKVLEFERAMNGLEEMIAVVDRDYRYVIANRSFLTYRGILQDDLIGRRIPDVLSPDVFETTVKEKLDECFQGKVVEYEMRYDFLSRGKRDLSVCYFPLEGPKGVDRAAIVLRDITDLKRAENALHEREEKFHQMANNIQEIFWMVDTATQQAIYVNPAFERITGRTIASVLDAPLSYREIIHHDDRQRVLSRLLDATTSGFLDEEFRIVRPDGSIRWVEAQGFPVRNAEGQIYRLVGVAQDTTERKLARDAQHDSEDRYRDLVEHSEDLVCTHDLEGNLLSVNPTPARLLGYDVAEFLKIPMRDLIAPGYRGAFDDYLARIKLNGADRGLLCVLTRSGEQRIWEYNNTLRTKGVPTPIVRGMAHDITDRRRAELASQASEHRYRQLFEENVAGVAISSLEGEILDCNDAWAHTVGFASAEEVRGRRTSDFYYNISDREPLMEELIAKGTFFGREIQLKRKDGTPVWVLFNAATLQGKGVPVIQATAIDITEHRQAEQELRRNEERFRVALKDSPITVFNQDRDLRYTWVYNPQSHSREDIIGKTDDELLGPEMAARLIELKRQVLNTGTVLREEVLMQIGNKRAAFDLTIEPLLDADGSVIGITAAAVDIGRLREMTDRLQEAKDKLVLEKSYLESEIQAELGFEEIIGQSPSLRDVLKKARVVAPTDSTVLLLGETGTGKELVARAVHALSSRQGRNFIKLNCAAVPSGLLESELFGHEKGAFTGAISQKVGRIELADKGTLFLDEIGELPLELQPKLLRVLQDREFERLGGIHTLHVDVRIISATNRDLRQDIADRKFREDLFYRLNVFPVQLPPLRERRSDIPMLVQHFVTKHAVRMGKHVEAIPPETMDVLQNWSWPGNIRELENMIERMVIMTKGGTLAEPPVELDVPQEVTDDNLTEMEREHLIRILRETHGVLSGVDGAASRLGIKRTTLQSMLKRFGIEPRGYRRGTGTFGSE